MSKAKKEGVQRISVSLPGSVFQQLDTLVEARGFESRSQAISEMITQEIADYNTEMGNEVMTGTITLVYSHAKPGLQKKLSNIEYENIAEVITSLHVLLENEHTM